MMDAAVGASGVTREPKECACGKPRMTLLVPSNTVSYVPFDRETCRIGEPEPIICPLRVTICLACDGGIEWVKS